MERRLYWGIIGLLVASLGWFGVSVSLAGAGAPLEWEWTGFNRQVFASVMLGSVPVTVLIFLPLRLLLGAPRGRIIWIKHPAKTVEHLNPEPAGVVVERARQRLAELGFVAEPPAEGVTGMRQLFRKAKAEQVVRFIDHAFAGELLVQPESGGTRVLATVVFQDTIVLESGEGERMAALAGYLAGSVADLKVAILPFTMLCGIVIALANLVLLSVAAGRLWLAPHELSIALAAVGMILLGGYPILRHPAENYGLPLGVLGLVAALLPLVMG